MVSMNGTPKLHQNYHQNCIKSLVQSHPSLDNLGLPPLTPAIAPPSGDRRGGIPAARTGEAPEFILRGILGENLRPNNENLETKLQIIMNPHE